MSASELNRIATITSLLSLSERKLGRTAIMKLCFFLQSLKGVPMGYEFTLYSYGPFDSDVLADLQTAESLGVISSEITYYVGGYGYDIAPTERAQEVEKISKEFVEKYRPQIKWVSDTFSNLGAAELELLSTIVFIAQKKEVTLDSSLISHVHRVKPHFSPERIGEKVSWLRRKGILD